jgi:sterol desaturase/sphingolipid hydroxylase (fatty acid hydroxylase superfamily)
MPITILLTALLTTLFICIERAKPNTRLPGVQGWYARLALMISVEIGMLLLVRKLLVFLSDGESVFVLSNWNPLAGGLLAYALSTLIVYAWHRARHEFQWLWRVFHQLHHSPSRIEALTTFYRHPHELFANGLIGALVVFGLLGLGQIEATIYATLMVGVQLFYHANINTPRWIGYFIQRPEMHRIHHRTGYHRNNYGDLALWDLMFGTWENPEIAKEACGFSALNEVRVFDMLLCKDVHNENTK